MLEIVTTNQFKKELKLAIKRGCKEEDLFQVVSILANEEKLPTKYKDHALVESKKYHNARECHIYPDWLLIYRIDRDRLILSLIRNGSHSELFR